MRALFLNLGAIICLIFAIASCSKAPESTPVTKEVAPPAPSQKEKTIKAGDEVFILERFSVELEHGSKGFIPGTKVRVVSVDGDKVQITDGKFKATKPSRFFTLNHDDAKKITENRESLIRKADEKRTKHIESERERMASDLAKSEISKKEAAIKNHEARVNNLRLAISDLQRRIQTAADERISKGFPPNGGSRYPGYDRKVVTLSRDASGIQKLIQDKNQLQSELEKLLLNHPSN